MINLALDILNHHRDPDDINSTFIAFIPKNNNPRSPKDFRPISLCNIVMKVVKKSIANRMKGILPNIISEEQNVFAKGRLITDNALIAINYFHWMKNKNKGNKCPYDTVDKNVHIFYFLSVTYKWPT